MRIDLKKYNGKKYISIHQLREYRITSIKVKCECQNKDI